MITRLDLADSGGSGADLGPLTDRVTSLEDTYVQSTRYAEITTTTGTISPASSATIVLDYFGGGLDCDIQAMEAGEPNGLEAYDTSGEVIFATLDSGGAYVLSGVPVDASVALVYRVRQKFKDFNDLDADILGEVDFLGLQAVSHSLWETGRSGFVEWFGSGAYWSWDSGTKTWTLLRGGEGYIRHKEVYFAANQTITLANGDYKYFYIDEAGLLQKGDTNTKIDKQNRVNLFLVQLDAAGELIVIRNNHEFNLDNGAREWMDRGFGVVVDDEGSDISRYTTGTGGAATDRMVNITSGSLIDADIVESWSAVTSGITVNHTYRAAGGNFLRDSYSQQFPMKWNNAGTPTALNAGQFGVFRLFLIKSSLNDAAPQFVSEMDTSVYGNPTQAATAIANDTVSNFGRLNKELCQVGFVTVAMNASGGYVSVTNVAKVTLRQVTGGSGVGSIASNVVTDTTNFNGALGPTHTTVQAALEALDDVVGTTRIVNTTQTLLPTDTLILADVLSSTITLTLPPGNVTPLGKTIRIMNTAASVQNCYVYPQTGYNIDGFNNTTSGGIRLPFKASVTLVHVATDQWRILLSENWPMRTVTAASSTAIQGDELVRLLPGANQLFYIYSTVSAGKRMVIYRDKFNGTSFTCTVQDGSGAYINNAASLKLAPGECVTLISGNGEWFVEATTSTLMMQVAPAKATPIDADKFMLQDTAANNALSVTTYAQLKAALKTYFDTLYTPL